MIQVDLKSLMGKLNRHCSSALEGAAGLCVSHTGYEITIEHVLAKLCENTTGDVHAILSNYDVDPARVLRQITGVIEALKKGNAGRPKFSPALLEWIQDAWMVGSIDYGLGELRSGVLFFSLLRRRDRYLDDEVNAFAEIPIEDLKANLLAVTGGSEEAAQAAAGASGAGAAAAAPTGDSALERFCIDFTQRARDGKIDPVFGRDREIRQMIDILARRRKNNPIAVGEAGVGKTAAIEGLALQIAQGDVPDTLAGVRLLSLDLGLLQAGASVKGEFENRLNQVINEVKGSPTPIVLFIDEAHTLVGAGGAAGTGDAANLLKPALARGELRTVAATTWSEYKKYFEKDPALARRFQLVKLEEPDDEIAALVLRGLAEAYESAHGVRIYDEAVVACAKLASRYIAGRQHPDKGVDLLDTAAARVKLGHATKPAVLADLERRIETLQRERGAIQRDVDHGVTTEQARLAELDTEIEALQGETAELTTRWQTERDKVQSILELRRQIAAAKEGGEDADAPAADPAELNQQHDAAVTELQQLQGDDPLVSLDVTADVVAQVIGDWTGIPVGKMVRDEAETVLGFEGQLKQRIKGQDHAIAAIGEAVRASKAGINNPEQPIGVFLAVGTSGVGKTETALGLADLLFGGERFLTTINMSEFQEKHAVSRLIGSPPGYVGYGEGGLLTEAVRQRPYSVVLLDEVEKADPEVMNLFYQVFDKGALSDSEGRDVNFANTIVFLTSNLATAEITQMCSTGVMPSVEEIAETIRPVLSAHFKPALLARMTVIPFFPIGADIMQEITVLKLGSLARRLQANQRIEFTWTDAVPEQVAERCTEVDTGARNIDHILRGTLMPQISTELLQFMSSGSMPEKLHADLDEDGEFDLSFS